MSRWQWVTLTGFLAILAALLLALAHLDLWVAVVLLVAFAGYSAAVLHGAHRRLSRPAPGAPPHRTPRQAGHR